MHRMHARKHTDFFYAAARLDKQRKITRLVGAHRVAILHMRAAVGAEDRARNSGGLDQPLEIALPLIAASWRESR